MSKLLKKFSYVLLVLLAVFSILSIEVFNYSNSQILARESEGYLNFTNSIKYKDNDIVETIVILEDESLITSYQMNEYDTITDYIYSKTGKKIANQLLIQQQQLIENIKIENIEIDLSNSYNYTVVMNAVSLKTKVKNIDRIAKIPGVKDIIISNYYEAFDLSSEAKELEDISYTDVFMDSEKAWEAGYTGEGMAIAVIDTGTDVNHEAFMGDIENPRFDKESLDEIIKNVGLSAKGVLNSDSVYHSEKIPYAFDYAGNDSYAYAAGLDHGTHVAGIVGANSGKIRGVAVDAQIFVMKVFDDMGAAFETYILAGVEDALKLGVDVANMSLGSPCGNSYATEQAAKVYSQVREKGVNLIVAAGNDAYVGVNNIAGNNLPLASAPDYGVVASPSTYEYALSVASLDNKTYTTVCLNFEDKVYVEYAQTSNSYPIGYILDGQTLEFIEIPNVGNEEDYEGIDVEGKIALVPRGTISFSDKHNAAVKAGAVAMIVFDPNEDVLIGMQIENQEIPCVFISNKSYKKIIDAGVKTVSIKNNELHTIENPEAGYISSFSSWGTTLSLEIKPEITGPGGFINSSVGDNQYAEYSGTSMAAPNVAGVTALIRQYVKNRFPELNNQEVVDLVNQLLMSTANPIVGKNGVYTSVRAQGSGVANAYDAISTNALLSVKDAARPKAEIGSSTKGQYSYTLYVENIGTKNITYTLNTTPITDEYVEYEGQYYSTTTSRALSEEEIIISYSSNVIDNKIEVKPGEKVEIVVNLTLTDEFKNKQDEIFTNGSYVEGYTVLETTDDQNLVLPFLGFYGDFDNLPLLEGIPYEDKKGINLMGSVAAIFNASQTGYELGYNVATDEFYSEYIYYSCSNMQQNVLTSYNTLNRNIDFAKYVITDKDGNIVYETQEVNYKKGCYSSNAGAILAAYDYTGWDGTKKDGTKATNGEEYKYTTTLGYYEEDGTTVKYQETWSFNFKIDSTSPEFVKYEIVHEGENVYLDIYASDNVSASYAIVYSYDLKYQLAEAVGNCDGLTESKFRFDLNEIIAKMQENKTNPSQIKIEINDWAYNFVYENIILGPSNIKLEEEYKIAIDGTKELEPILVPTNIDKKILNYSSEDERIATVDENGVVTGISEGETTITVTGANGVSASTKVIVGGAIDTSIEITNGNLSLEIDDIEFLNVKILPNNAVDKTVTWKSDDENVVVVSSYGRLLAVGVGETTVTATSASGNIASIKVKVDYQAVSSVFLYSSCSTMYVGDSKRIERITVVPYVEDYSNIKFESSNEEIMTVSSQGVLTAHKEGVVTIYALSLDGKFTSSLTYIVSNVNATKIETTRQIEMLMNSTYQIQANVFPTNTTNKTLSYKSNNPDIVSVSENGEVTSHNIGTAEIEITCGNANVKCYVTVLPQKIESLSSDEQFILLNLNEEKELQIKISPENATFNRLFYSSSNEEVVSVVNGKIKAIALGTAVITVKTIDNIKYDFYVVVSMPEEKVNIRADFENIIIDEINQMYSLNLSSDEEKLYYSSDNEEVAIISNGNIYSLSEGITTIYVYNQKELIDTFVVEIKINNSNNCTSKAIIELTSIITLVTIGFMIIKKKY